MKHRRQDIAILKASQAVLGLMTSRLRISLSRFLLLSGLHPKFYYYLL